MHISVYDSSHPSPHTAVTSSHHTVAACTEIPIQLSQVQVYRRSAAALQNNMQITAYCAIGSFIYGHVLVLNLHSMWAGHWRKTHLLFWFITYCLYHSSCLCSSFLPLGPLFIFRFFMKLVALFTHICISVCTSTPLSSIPTPIAPLHSTALCQYCCSCFFVYICCLSH